ncbi:hypothetical protein [Haladaptatus sp. NG-SE-30]
MTKEQTFLTESFETAQNRAQAEQFAYDVDAPGLIEVTNQSHETPAAHQYVVSIDYGTLDAFPSEDNEDDAEDCDCDGLNGFPCWSCVKTGRKELPNEPRFSFSLRSHR